ncbi:MAG: hypothetical protein IT337_03695, partial [Thermomicrobiales bacterium]|nr:hypothetical protein [Thermomicrobiales bacterium]
NVVDIRASEGVLSYGQAEAVKELVATTAAPIEPGLFGERLFGSVVSVAERGRHVGMGGGARAMEPERGRMPASYEGDLPEMDEGGSDVRVDRASGRRRDRTDRTASQP